MCRRSEFGAQEHGGKRRRPDPPLDGKGRAVSPAAADAPGGAAPAEGIECAVDLRSERRSTAVKGGDQIHRSTEKAGRSRRPLPTRQAAPPRLRASNVPSIWSSDPETRILPVANQAERDSAAAMRRAK